MKRESYFLRLCILKRKIIDGHEPCQFAVRCTGCSELVDLRVEIQEDKTVRAIHVEGRKVLLRELAGRGTGRGEEAAV